MAKKSLLQTNPFLTDTKKYKASLVTSVASSTAIETATSTSVVAKSIKDILDTSRKKPKSPQ